MSKKTLDGFLKERGIAADASGYSPRSHHAQSIFDWAEETLPDDITLRRYPITAIDIDLTDGQE